MSEYHKGTDQLHIWNCMSINDIKRETKLKFVLEKRVRK